MMQFLDLHQQFKAYEPQIMQAIHKVLNEGQFIMGSEIAELENVLAQYIGVTHCLGVSSGTDGLLLAMQALGIGQGDEVICVPYTWISPVEVVRRLNATPVFVDIDPHTFVMDDSQIESKITKRTKAIVPVSLYGQMPNFEQIMKIAHKHGLVVIEDAAQSFGAKQKGKKSCSLATVSVTSFFPSKPLGCYGDGGAVFTNRDDLAEKMRALRVHGAPVRYDHQYIGMNGRLDTLQAAILLAKFPHFDQEIEQRNRVANFYNAHLAEEFLTPVTATGNTHTYAQYVLKTDHRSEVLALLDEQKIPNAIYYPKCIHEQEAYRDLGYKKGDFPCAEEICEKVFSIPMHPWLLEEELETIVNALKSSLLKMA